jgi:hypothetical protein
MQADELGRQVEEQEARDLEDERERLKAQQRRQRQESLERTIGFFTAGFGSFIVAILIAPLGVILGIRSMVTRRFALWNLLAVVIGATETFIFVHAIVAAVNHPGATGG